MPETATKNRIATAESSTTLETANGEASSESSQPFIGKWNELVSTTNWEKGQIISEWRDALIEDDAPASEYSDEAWAQLVGGVTSQHVGRLRRVFQQFSENCEQYPGLFWSHFQAALDWDDAEMWLEGAIQNGWSISQMRGKRWETVGKPGETMPEESAAEMEGSLEGTIEDAQELREANSESGSAPESISAKDTEVRSADSGQPNDDDKELPETDSLEDAPSVAKAKRERLSVEVDELPDDLADAFEQFKLAIISHRRVEWKETSCETVVECLEALKQLAEAPLD